jgi:sugar transferase (PEP-CTERM system associated)
MIRLFRVFVPAGAALLLLTEVLVLTAAFVAAAWIVVGVDPFLYLFYDNGIYRILAVVGCIVISLYFQDLYSRLKIRSRILLLQQMCAAVGIASLAQGVVSYFRLDLRLPVRIMLLGSALALVAATAWRLFYCKLVTAVLGGERLLLVGNSPLLDQIAGHVFEHAESGLRLAGYVQDPEPGVGVPAGAEWLGPMADLRSIVDSVQPTSIVVGMRERRNRLPMQTLLDLRLSGHQIEEAVTAYERLKCRVSVEELRPSQLIYSGELGPKRQSVLFQRVGNLSLAVVGAIISLPFALLTALAVRLSSPGPVLYTQVRVGLDGKPFQVYKFRSMYVNAEAATGAVWATKNDPRVTPVGRFIRRTRLDELPQLFNVIKGEMSMTGPRPERPEFVKALKEKIPYYEQRHCVRPGITGWAQINYKYGDSLTDTVTKLEYDLYYIKNMSFSLDAYILCHTVKAMILSRGAQ